GKIVDENRMRPPPSPARSRTRGHRTATAPMPVMISRSGRCPWRTSRRRPSSVNLSVWVLSQAATSASTACPNSVLAPLRKTSVSGSENVPGWVSSKTLVSVTRITPSVEKWRLEHPHDTPTACPNGARTLLGQAVEAEVAAWLSTPTDKLTDDGRRRLVRHGHLPEREIMTGIGAVAVRCPRVRDRAGEGGGRIRFSSTILPPYARRSKSLEVLIPILYLKGISTGDSEEALIALLGKDAGGLSASTIGRLKEAWSDEHTRWSKRDLSAKRYVYFWVDGIHVQARLEEAAQYLLVIIGATPEGKKELVGLI